MVSKIKPGKQPDDSNFSKMEAEQIIDRLLLHPQPRRTEKYIATKVGESSTITIDPCGSGSMPVMEDSIITGLMADVESLKRGREVRAKKNTDISDLKKEIQELRDLIKANKKQEKKGDIDKKLEKTLQSLKKDLEKCTKQTDDLGKKLRDELRAANDAIKTQAEDIRKLQAEIGKVRDQEAAIRDLENTMRAQKAEIAALREGKVDLETAVREHKGSIDNELKSVKGSIDNELKSLKGSIDNELKSLKGSSALIPNAGDDQHVSRKRQRDDDDEEAKARWARSIDERVKRNETEIKRIVKSIPRQDRASITSWDSPEKDWPYSYTTGPSKRRDDYPYHSRGGSSQVSSSAY